MLEEIIAEDTGLEQQLSQRIRPVLSSARWLGRSIAVVADPAGMQRSTVYEETSFDVLKRSGFMAYPAPTNDIDRRISAVESMLLGQRDGGPAFLIDGGKCPFLVRALSGGYRYAKTRAGLRKPTPDKNEYSHVMDALQYAALVANSGMSGMILNKLRAATRPVRARQHVGSGGWT